MPAIGEVDRLQIGAGVVDIPTREILMPGLRGTSRVTPKAIAVLCLLAETPGRVVSRAELLAHAWPTTLPTDDVLTQAVTQLRKAFGAGSTGAAAGWAYIETIAKTGYRLTVPVQALAEQASADEVGDAAVDPVAVDASAPSTPAAADAPVAAEPPLRVMRERIMLATTSLLLVAVALLGVLIVNMHASPVTTGGWGTAGALEKSYRLITNAAGFELSPTLSPDASMVAYAASGGGPDPRASDTGSAILLQTTTSAPPRALTFPGKGVSDDLPSWSPDGRDIAFARWSPDGSCRIMLVAAVGAGDEREIARCDNSELVSFDWAPDGDALIVGSMTGDVDGSGIRLLDPVSGRWTPLPYDTRPGSVDFRPRYSPDGKWIVFIRNPQLGDLWRIPAAGGTAEQLTHVDAEIRGWSWLGSADRLVFGMRVELQSRLYTLDLASGALQDIGIEDAQTPSVSRRGGMMAFVHRSPQFGIYQAGVNAARPTQRLFVSSGRDGQPTVSPDGRQIVFTSDRAGRFELWWADLARVEALRPIEGLRPDTAHAPIWSADSTRVLVSAYRDDDSAAVFEVTPATGLVAEVAVPGRRPLQAFFMPDPTQMLVLQGAEKGGTRLVLYDRNERPWRELASIDGVSNARVDASGENVLFTRFDSDGLWQASVALAGDTVRSVSEVPSRWLYRNWAPVEGGVVYLHGTQACRSQLSFLDVGTGDTVSMRCVDADALSTNNGISADLAGRQFYVALAVEDGSDIGFMAVPEDVDAAPSLVVKVLNLLKNYQS